jgi:hypothetical protein
LKMSIISFISKKQIDLINKERKLSFMYKLYVAIHVSIQSMYCLLENESSMYWSLGNVWAG